VSTWNWNTPCVRVTGTAADSKVVLFVRVMVTWGTAGSVEPEARMKPPWGTLVAFTEIWMAGPGGNVVVAGGRVVTVVGDVVGDGVVSAVVAMVVTVVVGVVGAGVSFPVSGGPVVGIVVITVACVGTRVVSTGVMGCVVAGTGVVTAGGRVRMTMVGVWDEVLSFRM
jgi:hypothetical protein